jgi:hypothetical protein
LSFLDNESIVFPFSLGVRSYSYLVVINNNNNKFSPLLFIQGV